MARRVRKAVADRGRNLEPRRIRLRRRVRHALHGSTASFISSNCVGGRISELAGDDYRSPTVGLLIDPVSFVEFVSDLPHYLTAEIVEDPAESERLGYPVGRMGPVTIGFMHYPSFAEAVATWRRRAERVRLDDVVVIYADRGDADCTARFLDLPIERKLLITTRTDLAGPHVARLDSVGDPLGIDMGDLYTNWERLEPVLTPERLALLRSAGVSDLR